MNLIFVFLDGVGLAERSARNPFFTIPMVRFRDVVGCEFFLEDVPYVTSDKVMLALDASLGVEGTGESGTGQFSIYTGVNGAKYFGRHYGAHIPSSLRAVLAEENIFRKLKALGKTCCYANAYPKSFIAWCLEQRAKGKVRSSVLFEAAILEQIPIRSSEALKVGEAISVDMIARWCRFNDTDGEVSVSEISATQAARNLLALSHHYDAVFYEFFLTDLVAHGKVDASVAEMVARLDEFLSVLIAELPERTILLLTSDHGNFEDTSTTRHTQNPVPFLAVGKEAVALSHIRAIDEVCKVMLKAAVL